MNTFDFKIQCKQREHRIKQATFYHNQQGLARENSTSRKNDIIFHGAHASHPPHKAGRKRKKKRMAV